VTRKVVRIITSILKLLLLGQQLHIITELDCCPNDNNLKSEGISVFSSFKGNKYISANNANGQKVLKNTMNEFHKKSSSPESRRMIHKSYTLFPSLTFTVS
jgi:hypothetical protein